MLRPYLPHTTRLHLSKCFEFCLVKNKQSKLPAQDIVLTNDVPLWFILDMSNTKEGLLHACALWSVVDVGKLL